MLILHVRLIIFDYLASLSVWLLSNLNMQRYNFVKKVKYCKSTLQILTLCQIDLLVHQIFCLHFTEIQETSFFWHQHSWQIAFKVSLTRFWWRKNLHLHVYTLVFALVGKHIQLGGRQLIMCLSDKLANQCYMTSKYLIASQRNYNQSKLLRIGKKILF